MRRRRNATFRNFDLKTTFPRLPLPRCEDGAVQSVLGSGCFVGPAVPPGLYVVRRLQFVRSGLTQSSVRTWREKNIFDVQALPVSQYCLHAVLILRASTPGPWISILLRSRTRYPQRDPLPDPLSSQRRVLPEFSTCPEPTFYPRFFCCLPGSHLLWL